MLLPFSTFATRSSSPSAPLFQMAKRVSRSRNRKKEEEESVAISVLLLHFLFAEKNKK
jgi:hypothetical protein